ncbi:hypothetical protein [Chitinibacter tainanensis]|uniref:hypothetical protein n=1 Tax=Chitinibacter tainanensis TaxID=230667 RepID=UPI000419B8AA|nr:hypothetical protein [Chitinibacter tainanensis]
MTLDTNYRYVRLTPAGYITTSKQADKSLCAHCGNQLACERAVLAPYSSAQRITECSDFLPVIAFQSDAGMTARFNTIRVGKAWAERVKIGTRVGLVSTKTGQIFGYGEVDAVYAGELQDVCDNFGADNHTLLGKEVDEPGKAIWRVLRNCYGNLAMQNKYATAIYMKRVS